mgnify:FL=1
MENKFISFEDFCKEKQCTEYIEWDCGYGNCISCKKVGQSENISEYPKDCNFLKEIIEFEKLKKITLWKYQDA